MEDRGFARKGSDFERDMVIGGRLAVLSISQTADLLGFLHWHNHLRGFTENDPKKNKKTRRDLVSSSRVDENALLMSEDGIGILVGDDGKATVPETTTCHDKGIRIASLNATPPTLTQCSYIQISYLY